MTDRILSHSSFSHIVDVPIERIDIADWLFNLPEAEYQRCCPPDHIAAGATSTDNGRRMSINVEMIGETLMIEHYIGEITEPHLCRMVFALGRLQPERTHEGARAVGTQRQADQQHTLRIHQLCHGDSARRNPRLR